MLIYSLSMSSQCRILFKFYYYLQVHTNGNECPNNIQSYFISSKKIFSYIILNLMYYLRRLFEDYDQNSFDIILFVLSSYLLVSFTFLHSFFYTIFITISNLFLPWLLNINNSDAPLKIFTVNIVQNIYCCFCRKVHKRISYNTRRTTYIICN